MMISDNDDNDNDVTLVASNSACPTIQECNAVQLDRLDFVSIP